ncbi:MAG: serine/threonine protein kinase [Planctomycetes bacterium]|nr:serine/threonine protein kinase [Planctomycetota bacterium]
MKEARRHEILRRLLADRAAGGLRPVDDYRREFATDLDLLEEELAALGSNEDIQGLPALRHYRPIRELGRGGQGIVYLAEDERLGRRVALKVLQLAGPAAVPLLARFRREALAASRLDHANICPVIESGVEGTLAYIAMRYVEGETLAARLAGSRDRRSFHVGVENADDGETGAGRATTEPAPAEPDRRQLLVMVEKIARALHAAHELGIVHRDVKPGNVIVTPNGEPVVLDFGLATALDGDDSSLTRSGELLGTPAYMAPEQLRAGEPRVDRRVDVWALGVILFELLAGRRPFAAPTRVALVRRIVEEEAPALGLVVRGLPRDLEVIVQVALARERDRRYATAEDLADDIRRHLENRPLRARPSSVLDRCRRWSRRNPVIALFLPALTVILALALLMTDDALEKSKRQAARLGALESVQADHRALDQAFALIDAGAIDQGRRLLGDLLARGVEADWCRFGLEDRFVVSPPAVDRPLVFLCRARAARLAGAFDEAEIAIVAAIIASDRPRRVLHGELRRLRLAQGRGTEARDLLEDIRSLWPELPEPLEPR